MHFSGPNRSNKVLSIFFFAKEIILYPFFIDVISFFNLHSRVNDRDKMYVSISHFLHKCTKIRKSLIADSEVLVSFHIVDVQVHAIDGNIQLIVLVNDFPYLIFIHVAPSALAKSKSPSWRNVALSYYATELFYNLKDALVFNQVNIGIEILKSNRKNVLIRISYIKRDPARRINIHSETFSVSPDNKEILSGIKRSFVFCMIGIIRAIADVDISSFIYSADCFTKSENTVFCTHIIFQFIFPLNSFKIWNFFFFIGKGNYH